MLPWWVENFWNGFCKPCYLIESVVNHKLNNTVPLNIFRFKVPISEDQMPSCLLQFIPLNSSAVLNHGRPKDLSFLANLSIFESSIETSKEICTSPFPQVIAHINCEFHFMNHATIILYYSFPAISTSHFVSCLPWYLVQYSNRWRAYFAWHCWKLWVQFIFTLCSEAMQQSLPPKMFYCWWGRNYRFVICDEMILFCAG